LNVSDADGAAVEVGAGPLATDAAATGAAVLDDTLVSVEALLPDSLELAVQDKIPSRASKLRADTAMTGNLAP